MGCRWVLAALLLCGSFAFAGDETDHEQRLQDLETENAELRTRLDRIEGASAEPSDDDNAALEEAIDSVLEDEGLGLAIVIRKGSTRGALQIFGDVGFIYTDPARDGRGNASFFNGSLDLFFTARVGDHFHVLSETVFQSKVGSGDADDSSKFDQERLWGAWAFSDALQIKFGLEHSPISLWNKIYHHGRWLELTVTRPLLAKFEAGGGILPMHEAGLAFLGDIQLDRGSVEYAVYISNGRGPEVTDVQEFSDRNNDKAVTFGAGYHFDSSESIFLGLFARRDRIPPNSSDPARTGSIDEWIVTAQFLLQSDTWDLISEFAYIHDDDRTSDTTFDSYSGYIQAGYHVNDNWTPYARFDVREMALGNPYFSPVDRDLDVYEVILGVRWDFLANAAWKFELGFGEREERDAAAAVDTHGYIRFSVQLAWVF